MHRAWHADWCEGMLQRLADKLPLRHGERVITSLMFLYIFGVMTFYYVLKPLRNSLFLTKFSSRELAYAYLLTAIFAGTLAALIFRLTRRLSPVRMMTVTNLGIIAMMLYFSWALGRQIENLPYIYFVFVQMVSGLTTAIFWLMAGYIYDSRQAKRLFPLLGAGAILGAIAGSILAEYLFRLLNPQFMVGVCIALCCALILVGRAAWRYRLVDAERPAARRFEEAESGAGDVIRTVLGSRHLALMALSVFLVIVASQLADWQVNDAAKAAYGNLPSREQGRAIGQFFARMNLITNALGVLIQVTLAGFLVRRFGIGAAVLFLPAGLLIASCGVFLHPGLMTAAIALGINNVLEHSLNRVGRELLYLPLSREVRKRIKIFIDVFSDKCGRGTAGILLLGLIAAFSAGVLLRATAITIVLFTTLGVIVSLWLRRTYQEAFRDRLTRREVDLAEADRYVDDPASVGMLVSALDSANERQTLYALRLLQSIRGVDFAAHLLPLLSHSSPFVRAEAGRALQALPGAHRTEAERLLGDASEDVRVAAVEYLCSGACGNATAMIEELLASRSVEIGIAAARWLAQNPQVHYEPPVESVERLTSSGGPNAARARAAAASLAGRLPEARSLSWLRQCIDDSDPMVVLAAARAAGAVGYQALVHDLVRLLSVRKFRAGIREALLSFGTRIVGTLGDIMSDPRLGVELKREIPWVLGRMATERSAAILLEYIDAGDQILKYRSVKALNRLRELNPDLPPCRPIIADRILAETKAYYEALTIQQALAAEGDGAGSSLLTRSLSERLDQNMELIFRLLGLQYPLKDIYSAYSALRGNRADRRASAIEFLDSLLRQDLRSLILPMIEESSTERLIERAAREFGLRRATREEALRVVLDQGDIWLRACAIHEIGARRLTDFEGACRELLCDPQPLVRETASRTLRQLTIDD